MKKTNLWQKKIALIGLTGILTSTSLTGCIGGEKADCSIKESHAHLYKNDDGLSRYINKEYLNYDGYSWTEEYEILSKEKLKLNEFEVKEDLLKIEENQDEILQIMNSQEDYYEYRYAYTYLQPISHIVSTGKTISVHYTYSPTTHYSWTKDENHSRLTGEIRLCHYVYQAVDIRKDEKGKYVIIASDYVDNIMEVADDYPYFRKKFYKVINPTLGKEIDYEDMETDDFENVQEGEVTLGRK